ncbi:hypothetical protein Gotur_029220 [Gossypium turneri]
MEKGFLIKRRIMRLSELGSKQNNMRKVIFWLRGMYQNYETLLALA